MKFLVTLTIFLVFSFAFVNCEEVLEEEQSVDLVSEEPIPEPNGDECKGVEEEDYLPVEGDCRHFIHCDAEVPHVKSCGKYMHYNKEAKVCDWPASAGCE